MICNTVIFYDIENLIGLFSGKTNTVLHLEEIYRRVLEMEGVTGVSVQRAYADWGLPIHRNLRNSVLQVGIEPVHIFNTNQYDKVKNAADVSLIIDAVDLAARRPEIENFVIASGDGIFAFLAKKLHEHGKRVIGCSFDRITNIIFRNACDFFIALEKNDSSIIATSTKRKTKSSAPVSTETQKLEPPIEEEEKPKILRKFPKTKYSEVLASANIEIMRDTGDTSGNMHVVRQLVEALFVDETKDLSGLEVSVFIIYVNHYLPGFKVRRHGFKRVGDFMRFVLTGSPYCMYSVTDNVLLMSTRDAAEAVNGKILDDVSGLLITLPDGSRYNSVFNIPEGQPFVYSITPQEKPKPVKPVIKPVAKVAKEETTKIARSKQTKSTASKSVANATPPETADKVAINTAKIVVDESSIRKWIKAQFEELSRTDALSPGEAKRMTTPEYSQETFGVRSPIFREIQTRSNLAEQRTVNGRIKYWKESFKFNGRTYIVYKEWVVGHHKDRFVAWLAANMK